MSILIQKTQQHYQREHPLSARPPALEAHVTLPQMETSSLRELLESFRALGFRFEIDFFRRVVNVDKDPALVALARENGATGFTSTTPTGHDLGIPGAMLTIKTSNYPEIVARVGKILAILLSTLRTGFNFEIERYVGASQRELTVVNFARDFPGFQRTQDAPLFENHVGWHGHTLLTNEQIVAGLTKAIGVPPHQIVDFSPQPTAAVTDRVITFYQPDLETTLLFRPKLDAVKAQMGAAYVIAEQVSAVGEPII